MDIYSGHINRLIEELSRLPGVGAKSAQRLAFRAERIPRLAAAQRERRI